MLQARKGGGRRQEGCRKQIAALSSATTVWEQGLREDLAEFATLAYEVDAAYRWAMDSKEPWPGEHADKVSKAETVFNRILLRLDRDVQSERHLIECVEEMRDSPNTLWVDRRRDLVDASVAAFRVRWADNLYRGA
jgi:hypothetical protein